MMPIHCFAPLAAVDATVLVLGSMPGKTSLDAGQYYAHQRNAFWPMMGELVGAHPDLPYADRVLRLSAAGIAVWDVLQSCVRASSLDADIRHDSLVTNDFATFFSDHPGITRVYFNGVKAEDCYRRHVLPKLENTSLIYTRLPSTSPANASISYEHRLAAWKTIVTSMCS